ncbi:MAG TPA: PP2C family protein-serine/threonine phosphatase, partial [Candidatus Rifleibacterium sp.]|nr:PP2C family protein-serine/threonine phosphatase [Candidatus Rifleibacterium sp.]
GDVMGKGLHAAMVGAGARNQLARVLWQLSLRDETRDLEPAKIMNSFRHVMESGLNQVQKFITMMYASFDMSQQLMTFVDAGHAPVLWYSAAEKIWREVKGNGGPVGLPFRRPFEQSCLTFAPGDIILFYSDGLWDGRNAAKESFGEAELMRCVSRLADCDARQFVESLLEDYRRFVVPGPFFDDLTMVAVRIPR